MKILLFVVFISVLLLSSCATVFSGNTDEVKISSEPIGALVSINGVPFGETPLSVDLEKGESYNIKLSKDGYEDGYAVLTNKVGAVWIVLDVFAGLIPLVVDAITGSWNSINPDHVHLVLSPSSPLS